MIQLKSYMYLVKQSSFRLRMYFSINWGGDASPFSLFSCKENWKKSNTYFADEGSKLRKYMFPAHSRNIYTATDSREYLNNGRGSKGKWRIREAINEGEFITEVSFDLLFKTLQAKIFVLHFNSLSLSMRGLMGLCLFIRRTKNTWLKL